jgi:aspartate/methionine/tyrosine aminotransferase
MEDLREKDHPGLHRYAEPRGIPKLLGAVSEKLRARNGIACEPGSVVITAGATGALACAVAACVEPDEEVLILASWHPSGRSSVGSSGPSAGAPWRSPSSIASATPTRRSRR